MLFFRFFLFGMSKAASSKCSIWANLLWSNKLVKNFSFIRTLLPAQLWFFAFGPSLMQLNWALSWNPIIFLRWRSDLRVSWTTSLSSWWIKFTFTLISQQPTLPLSSSTALCKLKHVFLFRTFFFKCCVSKFQDWNK